MSNWYFKVIHFLLFICMNIQLYSANTYYTISGFVRDSSSGEELIGSTIYIKNTRQGTITNNYGFYSISESSPSPGPIG